MEGRSRHERVFLVRMWCEGGTPSEATWRGSVHAIGAERRFYVTAPSEVAEVIEAALRDDAATKPAE